MPQQLRYQVHGNVIEHLTSPRFQAVVSIHDGQVAGIRHVEWVDKGRHITETHKQFMLATAMLAWSLQQEGH